MTTQTRPISLLIELDITVPSHWDHDQIEYTINNWGLGRAIWSSCSSFENASCQLVEPNPQDPDNPLYTSLNLDG